MFSPDSSGHIGGAGNPAASRIVGNISTDSTLQAFNIIILFFIQEAEFKEFEPRLKFQTRLENGWFHLKLYSVLRDLSRRSIGTSFWRFSDAVYLL